MAGAVLSLGDVDARPYVADHAAPHIPTREPTIADPPDLSVRALVSVLEREPPPSVDGRTIGSDQRLPVLGMNPRGPAEAAVARRSAPGKV